MLVATDNIDFAIKQQFCIVLAVVSVKEGLKSLASCNVRKNVLDVRVGFVEATEGLSGKLYA